MGPGLGDASNTRLCYGYEMIRKADTSGSSKSNRKRRSWRCKSRRADTLTARRSRADPSSSDVPGMWQVVRAEP
jgi:hypothetical protein